MFTTQFKATAVQAKTAAGQLDERRKCVRHKGQKEAIVIHPNGIHHILDISLKGLSFRCPEDEIFAPQWPIEIVFAGTSLYMIGVSVRLVHEKLDDMVSFISTPTKEIGVEFVNLDEENLAMLKKLLAYLEENTIN